MFLFLGDDIMEIVKLTDCDNPLFEKVVEWSYNWWGKPNGKSEEEVRLFLENSLMTTRLPQTFVAVENGEPLGMYQLSMHDDLFARPDIYPWLINVYVDEAARGRGVCAEMMKTVAENARAASLSELYLYTKHVGLYEKYGWEFIEYVKTFDENSPIERLYKLNY